MLRFCILYIYNLYQNPTKLKTRNYYCHFQKQKETFMKTYNAINENFSKVFAQLADGEGTLILQNEESPFDGGMTIEAQPRDKKKSKKQLTKNAISVSRVCFSINSFSGFDIK